MLKRCDVILIMEVSDLVWSLGLYVVLETSEL